MFTRPTSRLLQGMAVLGAASLGFAASPARAATFPCTINGTCGEGVYDAVGDKIITIDLLPTSASDLDFDTNNGNYSFTVNYPGQTPGVLDIVEYSIDIDTAGSPHQVFKTVRLTFDALDATVSKSVYKSQSDYLADPVANRLSLLTASGDTYTVIPGLRSLYIVDEIDASGGSIASLTNTFTQYTAVPGPLPLMGAGAAFGFSRRLRRRTRQAYNLG